MQVTQVVSGRFHHFHLARQLEQRNLLRGIWTSYPRFKLRQEQGVDFAKVHSVPEWYLAYAAALRLGVGQNYKKLRNSLSWRVSEQVDYAAASKLRDPTIVVGLSSAGLHSGQKALALGGRYVCDRGSSHINYQDEILEEEHRRWNIPLLVPNDRVVAKELAEYELAESIVVPSRFVLESFIERNVPRDKLRLIPYGARLDRFLPNGQPDPTRFTLLYVGNISVRKGFPYLLQAFAKFAHPSKRLIVVGPIESNMESVIANLPTQNVELLGKVSNEGLAQYYNLADAMVLPSNEEGLAMVMGEALACGCPVIATRNTGAEDLFDDGVEGLILPIRDVDALVRSFEFLADQPDRRVEMRIAARNRVAKIGGWDQYGELWSDLLSGMGATSPRQGSTRE